MLSRQKGAIFLKPATVTKLKSACFFVVDQMTAEEEYGEERSVLMPPPPRKRSRGPMPDPMSALLPLGEHVSRTAAALVGLSTQLINFPETYYAQELIAESVAHEILSAQQTSWHNGIKHGKWLAAKEVEKSKRNWSQMSALQSQLYDLQTRHEVLRGQYDEAKSVIARSSLRDISNILLERDA